MVRMVLAVTATCDCKALQAESQGLHIHRTTLVLTQNQVSPVGTAAVTPACDTRFVCWMHRRVAGAFRLQQCMSVLPAKVRC